MRQSLKERLKPPFKCNIGGNINLFDNAWLHIHVENSIFHYDIEDFIVDALNEKAERDFGERKRWKKAIDSDDYLCEVCDTSFYFNGHSPDNFRCKFCPHCGAPLDPPTERT